ncbi:hypothetical protein [Rhodohalobacter sp. 614A]|uniref:hypothetical protein n=1 Tax=Rhodohalobacter sp. 614A TaxID=2908649 RepID=UPI001F315434|nr:hypothetical protein [Rhodohalobacter sp. 614A]
MESSNKRIGSFISALVLVVVFAQGCSDVMGPNNADSRLNADNYENAALAETCVSETSVILKAGRNSIEAGTVTYSIDDENVYVTYYANNGWGITETHLWVGTDLNDLPTAGNNAPKNGHFPYGDTFGVAQTSITYTISLASLGLSDSADLEDLYIVAHAVVGEIKGGSVKKTETAYAGDEEGESKRWWWYIHVNEFDECNPGGGGIGGTGGGNR